MTNSLNKMAGKNNAERNGTPGRARNTSKMRPGLLKLPSAIYINSKQLARPPHHQQQQLYGSPPPARTSPGLLAGYFAGGKWSEPPSAATLPQPPQHWTQLIFANKPAQAADIASQLKVLLNVQA